MVATTVAFTLGLAWLGLNIAFYALFLTQVRNFSLNEAGTILAISALVGLLGVLIVPAISDAIGRRPAAVFAALLAGIGFLVFALVPLPGAGLTAVLALGSIGAGGLNSLAGATMPTELVPLRRGAAIGVCNLFAATLGITLSPVLGGILADRFGLAVPVVLAAVCELAIVPIVLAIPETAPRVLRRRTAVPAAPPEGIVPA
jgi:MFS family permease